jgi:hypothetical protein
MAYRLNRYNNDLLTVVNDGTVDNSTSLKFIGKNFAGYGEIQNENFLHLLENFSNTSAPPRALSGQIWYDSVNRKIKFYNGLTWRTTSGFEVASEPPVGLTAGDFWWDTVNQQLYVYNGDSFVLIGPQAAGTGVTQMVSREIFDVNDNIRTIIAATVDDTVVAVLSSVEFTAKTPLVDLPGFNGYIRQGITLPNTGPNGITNSSYRFWGTASNSDRLGGKVAADYVTQDQLDDLVFTDGITIQNDLRLYVESDLAFIEHGNKSSSKIVFKVTDAAQQFQIPAVIDSSGMMPSTTNTFNLGSTSARWNTIYANTFNGVATAAQALRIDSTNYIASSTATANTVAVRDGLGNIVANTITGNLVGNVTGNVTGNAGTVTNGVYTTRSIATGTGLTGGGDLSQNRTIELTGQALALHSLTTPGFFVRTTTGIASRTITGTVNQVIVASGDGAVGNPNISLVIASQIEAEEGTNNIKVMTPLRTKEAISGRLVIASQAEAQAGVDNTKLMTPLRTKQAINAQDTGLGVNQTYELPERKSNTSYLNDTGRPIQVSVGGMGTVMVGGSDQGPDTIETADFEISTNNIEWIKFTSNQAIILPGMYYRVYYRVSSPPNPDSFPEINWTRGWIELR